MSEATALSSPPHRRRPIRSRTYLNIIQLLSHCHTSSFQLHGSSKCVGLSQGSDENIQIYHGELKSAELLVPNDILVQGNRIYKSVANVGFQDGDFDDERTTVSELGCANSVTNGEDVVTRAVGMSCGDFLIGENLQVDCAVQTAKEQENLDSVHVGSMGQLTVDKDFSIDDFSEVLDSCFGGDVVSESPKLGNNSKENNSALEVNNSKEFGYQVLLKEMELEKLVSTSGVDEEIEEGEIYVETGVCDMSIDLLSNNDASLGRISIHTSEDNAYKEDFTCKREDWGLPRHDACVDKENGCVKVENRASFRPSLYIQSQSSVDGDDMKTQGFDARPTFLETLPLSGISLQKHINDNPISATTKKVGNDGTNRRKNSSSAKERNAEKKKRKRAEKNRKLGIKRLKLQTVSKPKKIVYCRHYLQGKCHEGEKCKFSHDTTPLTKSKPCGHFARNSCMKGDDCPYDHQLSKYPCNNYASTGFCNRGYDCLFSHKMPENQIQSMAHNALKPELKSEQRKGPDKAGSFTASIVNRPEKFLPQICNSNSSNSSDILKSHQKDDTKFSSPGKSGKSAAKFVAKPFSRTVAHAPKGVCFLTDISPGPNSKLKLDESVRKSGDAVEVVREANPRGSSSTDKNKTSADVTSKRPRGVNFLSFAQSSLDGSSLETFSNFFSNRFKEAGQLVVAELADGKQTRLLPKSDELFEDHGQTSGNVPDLSPNLNGEANRTPATIPSHITSVSQHKNQPDDSTSLDKSQPGDSTLGGPDDNKDGAFLSSTEEKLTKPCKFPVKTHWLPFGGSSDRSASAGYPQTISSPFKMSLLSNTPSLVQKAVQSTLEFAAKFEPQIK